MGVMFVYRCALVADNRTSKTVSDAICLQQRDSAMTKTVEAQLGTFSSPSPSNRPRRMAARLNQPSFNEDLPKLVAQHASPFRLRQSGKNEGVWVITRR